jgi:hypothetical protein
MFSSTASTARLGAGSPGGGSARVASRPVSREVADKSFSLG